MWLQRQPLSVKLHARAENGLAEYSSMITAQLWDNFAPLMDENNVDDRRSRHYKNNGSAVFYGQKDIPELDEVKGT